MPLLTDFIPQATLIPLNGNLGLGTTTPNERLTVVGNISATGLVRATATLAGNLTGGSAGQVPYQASGNITLFTATGNNGQVLQSNGSGAPTWVNQSGVVAGSATVLSNVRTLWGQSFDGSANVSGNLSNVGNIVLGNNAAPNKVTLQYNGSNARTYTMTDVGGNADFVMTVGTQSIGGDKTFSNVVNATTTLAGSLTGGAVGQVVYQNGPNSTAFTIAGNDGQLLRSRGNAAPDWVNSTSLSVNFATTTQHLQGGNTGHLPYQSATNQTAFLASGTTGQLLQSNGNAAPSWLSQNQIAASTAGTLSASRTLWGQSFNGGANVSGNINVGGNVTNVGNIVLGNSADPNKATIQYTGTAARTFTITDVGAAADFVMSQGSQTIAGTKTFSSNLTLDGASTSLLIGGTNKATISVASLAAARTYTIPDAGAAASFVMTAGDQTIAGTKTHSGKIAFGSTARQMIDLWGSTGEYGIGIGSSTTYFRSNSRFSWYRLGVHSNTENDPGTGGSVAMTLDGNSDLTLGRNLLLGTQTNKATLTYTTNTARTYTIPDAGANADFVMNQGNQTIAGTKTFSSTIAGSVNGTAVGIAGGVQYNIPVQSGVGSTTFITNGTTNQILTYTASGPAWQTPTLGIPTITNANTNLTVGQVVGIDTRTSVVSATLPASPTAGNRIEIFDAYRTWGSNNCIIVRNNQNIDNLPENLVCDVAGSYITLIYIDATEGWNFYNTQS